MKKTIQGGPIKKALSLKKHIAKNWGVKFDTGALLFNTSLVYSSALLDVKSLPILELNYVQYSDVMA